MSRRFFWFAVVGFLGIISSLLSFIIGIILYVLLIAFLFYVKRYPWKMIGLLSFVFVFYIMIGMIHEDNRQTSFTGKEQSFIVHIEKSFHIDGQNVRGQVSVISPKEKVMLTYRLKTEQEKLFFAEGLSYPIKCKLTGTLQQPSEARNKHAFHYRDYLYQLNIHWVLAAEKFDARQCKPLKSTPIHYISNVREKGITYLEQHFPAESAPLAAALIFGERDLLDESVLENYQKLGIIHLLAISGLHVGLVSGMAYFVCIRFGLTKEGTIKLLLLLLPIYALLTGAAPSVIRAVMMICFVLASQLLIRMKVEPLDGISIAFLLFLFVRPYQLFHPGFQLSFFVSLALIVSAPYIFTRYQSRLAQLFVVSITAQMASFPILLYHFYEFSTISIIMNVFYVPLFSMIVLPLSLLTFLGHFIFPLLTTPFLVILSKIIVTINKFAEIFAGLPFSTMILGRAHPLVFIGYFIAISIFFYQWEQDKQTRIKIYSMFLPLVIIFIQFIGNQYSPYGEVTFIDVGQGDSIFIQLPYNQGNYLIDTGGMVLFQSESWRERKNKFEPGRDIVLPFLKSKGVSRVDKLIITHGDMDHMGGSFSLLEQLTVKEIVLPLVKERSEVETQLVEMAIDKNIPIQVVRKGNRWKKGQASFQVVSPIDQSMDRNDGSIVIYSKMGGLTWLFTGDLEEKGEKVLVETFPQLQVDVLKVGHHGSKSSSTDIFLKHIDARYAIISAGVSNRYGHPHDEVVTRLLENNMNIFRTDEHGAITYQYFSKKDGTFSQQFP